MMSPDSRNEHEHPQDDDRTARSHAGEAITDSRNWPGYIFIGAAFVALALTLTAAGYGFAGWVWIGAPVCIVLFAIGLTVVLLEHKRVMAAEGKNLTDPSGH